MRIWEFTRNLWEKIFLTRCLVLHSLPPLKETRLHYIGNRYIGRRVFPAGWDFHKPTVANTIIVAKVTFLPNLFHNFYYFQSHSKLSVHSHQTYNIQPYHLSFYHSSLPTHQSRYFHHQNPLYESWYSYLSETHSRSNKYILPVNPCNFQYKGRGNYPSPLSVSILWLS